MRQPRVTAALMGEQPMAIIIPLFQDPPDKLVLLCTPATRRYAEYIRSALSLSQVTAGIDVTIHDAPLQPYNPESLSRTCADVAQEHKNCELTFNISGGTKTMSIAAFACSQSFDATSIYVVTEGKGKIIKWLDNRVEQQDIKVNIPVDVRFAAHGLTAVRGPEMEEHWLEASGLLARLSGTSVGRRLSYFASDKGTGSSQLTISHCPPRERLALMKLSEIGFLAASTDRNKVSIRLFDDPLIKGFICGRWLEGYVYRACTRTAGAVQLFDHCWPNVVVSDADGEVVNELDLVICRNEEMAVCSCKAGAWALRDDARAAIYELDSVASPMRVGRYCRKVLIMAREDIPRSVLERAEDSRIHIISGQDIMHVASKLSQVLEC